MSHDDLNNDFLSGALRGAADAMPGGEVDDLNVSFGVVRDRVRRRRAVKVGGLAGASLAVAGVLAFGVTQSPVWNTTEPVLPGDPSTSASADPAPTGPPATSVITDGYAPQWIADLGLGLECGMPVEDLTTTADGWTAAAGGDLYGRTSDQGGDAVPSRHMAATVEGGALDVPPVLVWSQDGQVVDLGSNVFGGSTPAEPLLGGGDGTVQAESGAYTTCAPSQGDAGDEYQTPLPQGDYEVRVVAFPQVDGGWGAVVSDPVAVRLDADGAHTPTGTRGGAATIEIPGPADGEITRFELDRTTAWATAGQTWRGYSSDAPMQVVGACESSDPQDVLPLEVVLPSTGDVLVTAQLTCDGEETTEPLGVLSGGENALDLRLVDVSDGTARAWVSLQPAASDDSAGACSAEGTDLRWDPANSPGAAAGATAEALVNAALACDSAQLVERANQDGTEVMFGETVDQMFALPDTDTQRYRTLVALLAGTTGAVDSDTGDVRWPRVATPEFRDDDAAWQEVVDAGLLTQEDADAQRADDVFGYTGMTIAIGADGTWLYYTPTD